MGNGSKANSMSSLALTLIENYYKAGFDDETIMSSINKLLMLTESETYSTVDLCVLDLKNNNYSFIKLGASVSFIKNGYTTTEVEGSGLPIGILENIKPHIIGKKISEFDTLILYLENIQIPKHGLRLQYILAFFLSTHPLLHIHLLFLPFQK